jgi:hypothetical protein|tara:strand:- start:519 stop:896 length:378 start_codon:yes stop_codon:yes gene_type:complete
MSNLKSARGKLSQEQRDFLITNSEMPTTKLKTEFRRKFNRKISVNSLANFYSRTNSEPINFDDRTTCNFDTEYVYLRNSNGDEVRIDARVFSKNFLAEVASMKQIQLRREHDNAVLFWNNLVQSV